MLLLSRSLHLNSYPLFVGVLSIVCLMCPMKLVNMCFVVKLIFFITRNEFGCVLYLRELSCLALGVQMQQAVLNGISLNAT